MKHAKENTGSSKCSSKTRWIITVLVSTVWYFVLSSLHGVHRLAEPSNFIISSSILADDKPSQDHRASNSTLNECSLTNSSGNCSCYVSVGGFMSPGLGNQLFYFAAALHLAELTGREVVLFPHHTVRTLDATFNLKVRRVNGACPTFDFRQAGSGYDARLDTLGNDSRTTGKAIIISGFFQSFRYVINITDQLSRHYAFKDDAKEFAKKFLKQNIPPGWDQDFLRVGIHIRRGDFLPLQYAGFTVATASYFQKAMTHYVERYGKIQFIVATVDSKWAKENIYFSGNKNVSKELANITFSFGHSAVQDLAIFSHCDHMIISTGSYSWWSGWFSGGDTVYYSNYPKPGTKLYADINPKNNYCPPNWIPME